jgi:hypothetical protein
MLYAEPMTALAFWKAVVEDGSNFLEGIIKLLEDAGIRYCVIGGVAVNAYAEPIVTQDLDVVVAAEDLVRVRGLLERQFRIREFPYTWNVREPGSKLQVQIQLRPEFDPYVDRSERREVMGLWVPVASASDLLEAKVNAAIEPTRRGSKRLKDVADIRRLVDSFPALRGAVPASLVPMVFFDESEPPER